MKKLLPILLAIVLSMQFLTGCASESKEPLRLHVVANSNSKEDQAVKLKVRDELLADSGSAMENMQSMAQAEDYVQSHINEITQNANGVLRQNGFEYTASVNVGESYFPEKQYGDTVYPAGTYQAVQIVLGKGAGDNWWCVIFPPLCIVAVSSDEKEAYLNDSNRSAYAGQNKDFNGKIQYKSIFAELFGRK